MYVCAREGVRKYVRRGGTYVLVVERREEKAAVTEDIGRTQLREWSVNTESR